jgi:hypothetical protein
MQEDSPYCLTYATVKNSLLKRKAPYINRLNKQIESRIIHLFS